MRTVLPITSSVASASNAAMTATARSPKSQDVGEAPPPGRVVLHEIDALVVAQLGDERRIVLVGELARRDDQHGRQRIFLEDVQRFAETRKLAEFGKTLLGRLDRSTSATSSRLRTSAAKPLAAGAAIDGFRKTVTSRASRRPPESARALSNAI